MGNLSDYFERNAYKPKWQIGDRVEGKYHGIPFVGSVGNDTKISDIEGPRVSVHLDLPIKYENTVKSIILVSPKSLKKRQ